jgi:hypothetical protein
MKIPPQYSMAALIGLACFLIVPSAAVAQTSWLEAPPQAWNSPGMAVPAAPPLDGPEDPRCAQRSQRPPETAQDQQVAAAGWKLFAPYRAGWGITIISGLVGYDGMCRPFTFQTFVFVDGAFAGTISPEPMASRTDGSGRLDEFFDGSGTLSGSFARYGPNDPLCCPSSNSSVQYRIDRTPSGPVLVPTKITTTPNQR